MADRFAEDNELRAWTSERRRRKGEHASLSHKEPQDSSRLGSVDELAILVGAGPAMDGVGGLEELHQLALTAGARVLGEVMQRRRTPHPATYLGSGKLAEVKELCEETGATLVITDDDLTPAQVRNMEKVLDLRVIDRSELIIDIFATHAGTRQARLQVELAQLQYLAPRLKRMWTHLSRITGAGGIGSRGPGEKQIEVDRRIIQRRIRDLKHELAEIEARRERQARSRRNIFKVALVGYTNAGKSTLMRRLTGADVLVEDKLFATLDTRTRRWAVASSLEVLLSDTVGFIDKLPHHLVASFHATLAEVRDADLLLHVADAGDLELERRCAVVRRVLKEIGAGEIPEVLLLNKIDILPDPVEATILARRHRAALALSARTGEGSEELSNLVRSRASAGYTRVDIELPAADGATLSLIAREGTLISRECVADRLRVQALVPEALVERLTAACLKIHGGPPKAPGG